MGYFYEYKDKNGNITGGHNLDIIEFSDNVIKLIGEDIIPAFPDNEKQVWVIPLNVEEIEYLKIRPMIEKEVE